MSITVSTVIAIIVILFLAVFAAVGFKKGLLRILFTTFSFVIIIAASSLLTKPLAGLLKDHTFVGSSVSSRITEYVSEQTQAFETDIVVGAEDSLIDTLPLPGFLKTDLKTGNTLTHYVEMGVNSFSGYLSARLISIVMYAIAFILLMLLLSILFRLIVFILKIISKIPVIHGINRLFGGLFGLAEGLLILWCICIFIMIFSGTESGKTCTDIIAGSKVLTFIYDHNLPVMAFRHFTGIL